MVGSLSAAGGLPVVGGLLGGGSPLGGLGGMVIPRYVVDVADLRLPARLTW